MLAGLAELGKCGRKEPAVAVMLNMAGARLKIPSFLFSIFDVYSLHLREVCTAACPLSAAMEA